MALPNVIADTCTFYWDIRVIPEDDVFVIIDEFISYTKNWKAN
ncbi:MAG: peptidase dimerization domain-containing protein [Saprospiraceae bacterium]|nr:peptidase dimerization domain-containing protein [Saprospiraceae bacterium]